MEKQALMTVLETESVIIFVKANGDTREMSAVINPDQPVQYENSDAVGVIDTILNQYRAIKAHSVLSINGEMV